MTMYQLSNPQLSIFISSLGAELCKVTAPDGTEYLWNADPAFWKRHSPVLFPVVGNFTNKHFRYQGQFWPMGQHGFARDTEFEMVEQTNDHITFQLCSNDETRRVYPLDFILQIGYVLKNNSIQVNWNVVNPGEKPLSFSIGAHPAFNCPINGKGKQTDYTIDFHTDQTEISCGVLNAQGTLSEEIAIYPLKQGKLALTEHLFDKDALIVEGGQIQKLALCLPDGIPYVSMDFSAPLFGIWSPAGKQAPFVCLEPWYGRSDRQDFQGELSEREYETTLSPGQDFQASYSMTFYPVSC